MSNGDSALDNKLRKMIYNQIVEYPGISFNKLKSIFEQNESSLRYHLYYLERNSKISSDLNKSVRRYYPHPASVIIPNKPQEPLESHKLSLHQEHILNLIIRYPGINQKEISKRTGMNRFKVRRNINTLKDMNLIRNNRYQNMVCYEYNPDVEMKYRIMKGLIVKLLKNEIDEQTFLRLKRRLE